MSRIDLQKIVLGVEFLSNFERALPSFGEEDRKSFLPHFESPFHGSDEFRSLKPSLDRPLRYFRSLSPFEQPNQHEMIQAGFAFPIALGISALAHGGAFVYDSSGHYYTTRFAKPEERALVLEAQEELTAWKKGAGSLANLGEFFVNVESRLGRGRVTAAEREGIIDEWSRKHKVYKRYSHYLGNDRDEKIRRFVYKLYVDYLHYYEEHHSDMKEVIQEKKSQCLSQSKISLAAFTKTPVLLPEGQVYAVQIFTNHMQPVIYDRKTGEVLNLVTLEKLSTVKGPIYDPEIFYHAFLKRRGWSLSPVSENDLLIAAPNDVDAANNRAFAPVATGDENFLFPATDALFEGSVKEGPIHPPKGFHYAPDDETIMALTAERKGNEISVQNPKIPAGEIKVFTPDEYHWDDKFRMVVEGPYQLLGFSLGVDRGELVLPSLEEKHIFLSLQDRKQKRDFINRKLNAISKTPEFLAHRELLQNFQYQVRRQPLEVLEKNLQFHKKFEFALLMVESSDVWLNLHFPIDHVGMNCEDFFWKEMDEVNPNWSSYRKSEIDLKRWAKERQKEFFIFLDTLPLDRKLWVSEFFQSWHSFTEVAREPLISFFHNKVGIRSEAIMQNPVVEFPIWEDPPNPPPLVAAIQMGEPGGAVSDTGSQDSTLISLDSAMIFLMTNHMHFNLPRFPGDSSQPHSTLVPQKWNADMIRSFQRVNHEGKYDANFIEYLRRNLGNKEELRIQRIEKNHQVEALKKHYPHLGEILEEVQMRRSRDRGK